MTKFYILTAKKEKDIFYYIFVELDKVKLATNRLRKLGFSTNYVSGSGNNIALMGKGIKFDITTMTKKGV